MGAEQSAENKSEAPSTANAITVVNLPTSSATIDGDEDYQRISGLPTFEPILRTHIVEEAKLTHMDRINPINLAKVVNRVSVHINECDNVLLTYQHKLGLKVKETEQKSKHVASLVAERQKKFQKSVNVSRKIETVHSDLKKLLASFEHMIIMCDELNMGLPPSHRLKPFRLSDYT